MNMKTIKQSQSVMAPILIFSLLSFMSCSHRQPSGTSGELFSDLKSDSPNNNASAADTTEVAAQEQAVSGDAAPQTLDSNTAEMTADLSSSSSSTEQPSNSATSDSQTTALMSPSELEASAPEVSATTSEASVAPLETAASSPEAEVSTLGTLASNSAVENSNSSVAGSQQATAQMETPSNIVAEEGSVTVDNSANSAKKTSTRKANSSAQEIPNSSIWKKGTSLNRFYFVRPNDTAESIAELIYGSSSRAQDLVEWNGKNFSVGKMILFVSPSNASDSEMKSLFEERGMAAQEYTVQKGDWLSKIALSTYGSNQSWKEIAAINKLSAPDSLNVGDKIALYPNKISSSDAKVASSEVSPSSESSEVATSAPLLKERAASFPLFADEKSEKSNAAPTDSAVTGSQKAGERSGDLEEDEPELASANVGSFFEQHFSAIMTALIVLVAGLLIMRSFGFGRRDFQD